MPKHIFFWKRHSSKASSFLFSVVLLSLANSCFFKHSVLQVFFLFRLQGVANIFEDGFVSESFYENVQVPKKKKKKSIFCKQPQKESSFTRC